MPSPSRWPRGITIDAICHPQIFLELLNRSRLLTRRRALIYCIFRCEERTIGRDRSSGCWREGGASSQRRQRACYGRGGRRRLIWHHNVLGVDMNLTDCYGVASRLRSLAVLSFCAVVRPRPPYGFGIYKLTRTSQFASLLSSPTQHKITCSSEK